MAVFLMKAIDRYTGIIFVALLSLFSKRKEIRPEIIKQLALLQLWGIGETITVLPALKALRKKFPKAEITAICTKRVASVFQAYPLIDKIKEIPLNPLGLCWFAARNWRRFDLVIDVEEYLNISALLCFCLGKQRIGFSHKMRAHLYNAVVEYNDQQHVAQTHMDLLQPLGIKEKVKHLEPLKIDAVAKKKMQQLLPKGLCIGISPGAAESSKSELILLSHTYLFELGLQ